MATPPRNYFSIRASITSCTWDVIPHPKGEWPWGACGKKQSQIMNSTKTWIRNDSYCAHPNKSEWTIICVSSKQKSSFTRNSATELTVPECCSWKKKKKKPCGLQNNTKKNIHKSLQKRLFIKQRPSLWPWDTTSWWLSNTSLYDCPLFLFFLGHLLLALR